MATKVLQFYRESKEQKTTVVQMPCKTTKAQETLEHYAVKINSDKTVSLSLKNPLTHVSLMISE